MKPNKVLIAAFTALACLVGSLASADERVITVASTTSTEQSGLFGHLLPAFEKDSAIKVRVVALGTGQALDMACSAWPSAVSSASTLAASGWPGS